MGIFRTLKVSDGHIPYWQEHMEKLQEDCQFLSLKMPAAVEGEMRSLVAACKGVWRLKILVSEKVSFTLEPYQFVAEAKRLTVFPEYMERPFAKVKPLHNFENKIIAQYAQEQGFDDALILDENQVILECSIANFLWVHDGVVHYSDPELPYYEGMMQRLCLKRALQLGMKVKPCRQRVEEIPEKASLFTSNAMQGMIPVIQIENRAFLRNIELESKFSL